jgi:predicted ATPase
MLESIVIKNYRSLKNLQLEDLGKINLITGKNNTGKSTLLEAISMYASKGEISWIYEILEDRGETIRTSSGSIKNPIETNINVLSSLFYGRRPSYDSKDAIFIGALDNTLFGPQTSSEKAVTLRLVKYREDTIPEADERGVERLRRKRTNLESGDNSLDFKVGFEISASGLTYMIPLEDERPYRLPYREILPRDIFQYVKNRNLDREINARLWDNVTLTEKETHVVEALKIVESNLERIAFVAKEESQRQRTAVIKLKNDNNVVPLRSMGDGINRILTFILALVNADNGYLLIDEFENGLHYSIQESLWKLIFQVAAIFNVQIFVTTHSQDCITAFENVLNQQTKVQGKLIRLENIDGLIKTIDFDKKELKIATDNDIETR